MTVSAATLIKEQQKLFVTDAELIRRLGVPEEAARRTIRVLDAQRSGFPRKQKIWGDRRYWPAVEQWLAQTNGMLWDDAARLIPEERSRNRPPRHPPLRSPAEGHTNGKA